ncbi:hypothetical protein GOP47_0021192 [Adiantum capillus-veneris]|uniref:Pentatricopeptide repeat-containing protein n=1 Tax=Adiantum capillus-veneris TaxID=13818 RepID=A0A9D4Z8F6_ADICA|nr:hypothetical protein GOP47_0021192 [Adiantum capillus-veneris]
MAAMSGGFLLHEHSASLRYSPPPVSSYLRPVETTMSTTEQKWTLSTEAENSLWKEDQATLMKVDSSDRCLQFVDLPTDKATLSSLLRKCGDDVALAQGKHIHSHIVNNSSLAKDTLLGNLLVQMYSKCNAFDDALDVFTSIQQKNVYSWTLILGSCIQHRKGKLALELFHQMRTGGAIPDKVTYVTALDACASKCTLSQGQIIHAEVIGYGFEMDVFVGTALSSMYGRCDALDAACLMFHRMPTCNVVSWNAICTACVQNGKRKRALEIFHHMLRNGILPSNFSFLSALQACSTLLEAQTIYDCIRRFGFESDVVVSTALVATYGRLGRLDDARKVFESMKTKTAVSWSAMIAAYAQNGQGKEALQLFHKMESCGVSPSETIFTSVLSACAFEAALGKGELIHCSGVCLAMDDGLLFVNALIDMYANCGQLETAQHIFDKMCKRDVSSWNIMTGAHALYGNANNALAIFQEMLQDGVTPDRFTFNNILSGCSHAGLINEAHFYFLSMQQVFGVTQMVEHFNCIIDMLARAGRLDESEHIINHMPVESIYTSWMPLLCGCKLHNDSQRAHQVSRSLFALEKDISGPYVVLSHSLQMLSG